MARSQFANQLGRLKNLVADRLADYLDLNPDNKTDLDLNSDVTARTIDEMRHRLGLLIVERHKLEKEREEIEQIVRDVAEGAESAISAGREDLARAALSRKARLSQHFQDTAHQLRRIEEDSQFLEETIRALAVQSTTTDKGDVEGQLKELDRLKAEIQRELDLGKEPDE